MTDTPNLKHLQRDPEYYLIGGDLHLLAGEYLFRVHSHFFLREPSIFREWLPYPPKSDPAALENPSSRIPGSSDSHALMLKVAPEELAAFLWVFYNPKYSVYDAPLEQWQCILALADDWHFPEVKDLALRELDQISMPVVERIILYEKHKAEGKYLRPLYVELCVRPEPLSFAEAEALGMQTQWIIFRARERLRASSKDSLMSPLPKDIGKDKVNELVDEVFREMPPNKRSESDILSGARGSHRSGGSSSAVNGSANGHTY